MNYEGHDIKANAVGRQRPTNQAEMINNIRSYLRSTQRQPDVVKRFFHEKHVESRICLNCSLFHALVSN